MPRLHLNLHGLYNSDQRPGERSATGKVVAGYSMRAGADTILLAAYVFEQERERDMEIQMAEFGLGRQITPRIVLAAGAGFGLDADSPDFRTTIVFQFSPGAPWFGRANYGRSPGGSAK